ncbi:S-adenosylmethionine sensor upstream of mTORC1 [Vanessa cardui]|uniref:S-adenosylmethionine sensor upstream of mTORC1 n=1 Tax=Vanessa cardui TaxID=171605 RepID=UPI001F13612D|nr:S-adenosylmethionine sensor upstream of mTORC1 [Vanessa cardui]XP_046972329.1 S-adenosylmethionine sensor upstream of mTORC1 [Vanessa cardui]
MASEEHKQLAHFLKTVHSTLRSSSAALGSDTAWQNHCSNKDVLHTYAKFMQKLATTHWEENSSDKLNSASSRIKWCADFSYDYFVNKSFEKCSQKEVEIGENNDIRINEKEQFSEPYKLLDVGSCYNPFKIYDFFDVLAIDLCPANEYVMECDFLQVSIGTDTNIVENKVKQLQENNFDIVTFCFLLEYIPTSEMRIKACENAYRLLKIGGLLLISTPDSKHVGANSKLMKCWRHTLANLGFSRIRYEKFRHMHCMAFRKCLNKDIAVRWAVIHKESYMDGSLHIPQDFSNVCKNSINCHEIKVEVKDFAELPFSDSDFI